MCGIWFYLCSNRLPCSSCSQLLSSDLSQRFPSLSRRGPDAMNCKLVELDSSHMVFVASTLFMRLPATPQPYPASGDDVLCWNGEDFSLADSRTSNDTANVFASFKSLGVVQAVQLVQGPFAFVYYDSKEMLLWFGRDCFGRRSLVFRISDTDNWRNMELSSTLCDVRSSLDKCWTELPSLGIYCLNLASTSQMTLFPFSYLDEMSAFNLGHMSLLVSDKKISCNIPRSIALYSNELTCNANSERPTMNELLENGPYKELVGHLKEQLLNAVRLRATKTLPTVCSNCFSSNSTKCSHAKVAVLFSGGLDSCLLAYLLHLVLPETECIDLLNVAFQRDNFSVPDRLSGIDGLNELEAVTQNKRQFNLVKIDVTNAELNEYRWSRISNLVRPAETVLDDSLGCALWFAARGQGSVDGKRWSSSTRVVLSGLGADELFAGYARHRTVFKRSSWSGLERELVMEVQRLWRRNLGRDDRIVADHGKEARFPFLDDQLVSWLNSVTVRSRADLSLAAGLGDKLLLRLVASHCGLVRASTRPKRAMQFGTRIAKVDSSRGQHGADKCSWLL